MRHALKSSLPVLIASSALLACASAAPPRELVDARAAYARAAASDASQISPVSLYDAKVALDRAEASFSDDADSPATRDRAYVATRKAQLAEVLASTELTRRNAAQLAARTQDSKEEAARAAHGELAQARAQLASTQQRLDAADQSLESEKRARSEAEHKAREALQKLSVANALAVKDEPRGTVITVPSGVLFASGKADLLPQAQAKLDPVAEALSHEAEHEILIEGHTDSQGSGASNVELSQRRAQTVRDYFASRGVPADHITATGVGEARPLADNASPEGRANNRRFEIVVRPIEKR